MKQTEPPGQSEAREPLWLDPVNQWFGAAPDASVDAKAFAVLRLLAERAGQLVTKQELFEGVWADTAVGDAVLDDRRARDPQRARDQAGQRG